MSLAIANRYARALAEVVLDPSAGVSPADAVAQVKAFAALVAESNELRNVLMSPAVSVANKRAVAARLCERIGAAGVINNFFNVVINHRRAAELDRIAEALETAIDERLGRVRAEVISAAPLDGARQAALVAELTRMTGKEVRSEFQVDPALLGGVAVRIGSKIYDGSVRGRLETLRRRLTAD